MMKNTGTGFKVVGPRGNYDVKAKENDIIHSIPTILNFGK